MPQGAAPSGFSSRRSDTADAAARAAFHAAAKVSAGRSAEAPGGQAQRCRPAATARCNAVTCSRTATTRNGDISEGTCEAVCCAGAEAAATSAATFEGTCAAACCAGADGGEWATISEATFAGGAGPGNRAFGLAGTHRRVTRNAVHCGAANSIAGTAGPTTDMVGLGVYRQGIWRGRLCAPANSIAGT